MPDELKTTPTYADWIKQMAQPAYSSDAPRWLARLIIETVLDEWARGAAVDLFRDHLWRQLRRDAVREMLAELRGHDLVCWCPLDQPCHADVLIELANA